MSLLKTMATKPCSMAFSDDGDYLAVGVEDLTASDYPALRILRTTEGSYRCADRLLEVEASYVSPAGFARLAWSKPGEGSAGGGLVAGGLSNGMVAVWDPIDVPVLDSSVGNTVHAAFPIQMEKTSGNLRKSYVTERSDRDKGQEVKLYSLPEEWRSHQEFTIIDDYLTSNPVRVRNFDSTLVDCPEKIDDYNGVNKMAAMFSCHSGPVRGICFSPHTSSYLISGASEGKVVLWDLLKTYCDSVPMSETVVSEADLSFLSWSPLMHNMIAVTSCAGETIVLDLRTKKAIASHCAVGTVISAVQWALFDPNTLLTAASQTSSSSLPFNFLDIRKMDKPLKSFGKEISGSNFISFCPTDRDKFLASTNDDIYTWSLHDGQIDGRLLCGTTCGEVHYRPCSGELFAASTQEGIRAYKWEVIDNTACPDSVE